MPCADSASRAVSVFHREYLSVNTPGMVSEVVSPPLPMHGNKVALLAQVINIAGSAPAAEFEIQGSYDGRVWDVVGAATTPVSVFGPVSTSQGAVAYAFIRAAARISGNAADRALFNVTLTFSAQ